MPSRKKYTIREILKKSTGRIKAKNCSASLESYRAQEDIWRFKVKCDEQYSTSKGHEVSIQIDTDSTKPILDNYFSARCNCAGWVYQGADYHARQNSYLLEKAKGLKGNGKAPATRDPENKNLICKHVYLSLLLIAREYRK